ncbi:MAG: glucose 1-dehydrogenase [Pseudomonadota bacterium]
MGRLQGKIALITGGARGLGEAMGRAMAAEGAAVALTDLLEEEGTRVAADLTEQGHKAMFLQQDVTDEARWDAVVAEVSDRFGGLNVLVNNAGIAAVGAIDEASFADWRRTQAVNLDSVFLGCRAGVRYMKDQGGGSIINISSIEGIVGNAVLAAYNASKGGVRLLTKSAAVRCAEAGFGVRVNSIHPGFVMTAMVSEGFADAPPEMADQVIAMTPMKRFGTPEEIAAGAVFLASEESAFMTGSELVIDGGVIAQ